MTALALEILKFEPMASGGKSLRLTESVAWEEFASYAEALISALGGCITDRADSPVERVWSASIGEALFWIAFGDFALGVSLDPQTPEADSLMPALRARLVQLREQGAG